MNLYRNESSSAKRNAQRNLIGRTHYVDDDTLRFHKSRILCTRIVAGGLLFALVESAALDMGNTKRGVRYVIFDVLGGVVGNRADLEHCYKRSGQALKAMLAEILTLDPVGLTLSAIARAEHYHAQEMAQLRIDVATAGLSALDFAPISGGAS